MKQSFLRERCYSNRDVNRSEVDSLVLWAINEMGTVDKFFICDTSSNNERIALAEQQERLRVAELGVLEEVLRVHSIALLGGNPEGFIRLIYKNVNGINNQISNNDKVEKAKELIDDLEADVVAYNKHRLNM